MGIENYLAFTIATAIFVITPGMDTIFVLNKTLSGGKKSGIHASLGVSTGVLVHTLLASFGVSLILAQSAIALDIIKYAGAIYLFYLGIKSIRFASKIHITNKPQKKEKSSYWSGLATNILNPKVALFFLAFFPQFILPEYVSSPIPFILLGLTFAGMGVLWCITLSLFAGIFTNKINQKPDSSIRIQKICGLVFILMAIAFAFM